MKQVIDSFKEAISAIIPGIEEANPAIVLRVIKDPSSLAICPTQKRKNVCWKKWYLGRRYQGYQMSYRTLKNQILSQNETRLYWENYSIPWRQLMNT